MNLTISRSVISLSKGISVVNQYTDFVPFSLNDQLSFELANQKYISATAVCRKKGAMLFCTNHPFCDPDEVHFPMNHEKTNVGGYNASDMREYLNRVVINLFPEEIRKEMMPFDNNDWLRLPTYNELFGPARAGLPSERWICCASPNGRIMRRIGNTFNDIMPASYWLGTTCEDYPNTFYYVNEKGEVGPCLANLNFFSIRLVFMLKNRD